MTTARVISLQLGQPEQRDGSGDGLLTRAWTTGMFRQPVDGAVWLGVNGLSGDGQADLRVHGGPDKAVNVYPSEHFSYWRGELHRPDIGNGAFGENFTTSGLVEEQVAIGDIFQIGQAVVQVSQPRNPCWKLARRWGVEDLAARFQATGLTGWYFRVLEEGHVQAGESLILVERPTEQWTVTRANQIMHHLKQDKDATLALVACETLAANWRERLQRRAETGTTGDDGARLFGR